MPRVSEERQLEYEIASTMEAATLTMLFESDSEHGKAENDHYGLLSALALVQHAISDSRYLKRSCRGSEAGYQSKRLLLSISDIPTEALWLVSAWTERAFRSL